MPYSGNEFTRHTVEHLRRSGLVNKIYLLAVTSEADIAGCETLEVDAVTQQPDDRPDHQARRAATHALLVTQNTPIEFVEHGVRADAPGGGDDRRGAGLLRLLRHPTSKQKRTPHPVNDYQLGSIRDDFNFGSRAAVRRARCAKTADAEIAGPDYKFAGLYALRLAASRRTQVLRIAEFLYSKIETDVRKSGEKQFDYVDPRNRAVQIEMEQVATDHLKRIGAYLRPGLQAGRVRRTGTSRSRRRSSSR